MVNPNPRYHHDGINEHRTFEMLAIKFDQVRDLAFCTGRTQSPGGVGQGERVPSNDETCVACGTAFAQCNPHPLTVTYSHKDQAAYRTLEELTRRHPTAHPW